MQIDMADSKTKQKSSFVVKEASLSDEKDRMLKILTGNRERKGYDYSKRYDWLYVNNPYGPATAWVIWNENENVPAGFTAVFPRKMLVKGKEYLAWNCGDFSIEKRFRALGVAVKLRKEAKRHVDEGNVPFLYAHPNDKMVHIHMRARHKKIAHMKRFALPIRISRYLDGKPLGSVAGAVLDPVISTGLRFKFRKVGEFDHKIKPEMAFDDSYREVCEELAASVPVVGLRDKEYLTWKFKQHPNYSYELFNYYENGKLTGYVIFGNFNGTANIPEFVCRNDRQTQQNMLSTFLHFLIKHKKNVSGVSMIVQEFNTILPVLEENGFKYRDDATSSVIAYSAHPELKSIVEDGKNWFMNVGDRDA